MDTVENVLTLFEKETQKWFQDTLGEPTLVQKEAWPGIKAGRHVLVSAPTGTGKTLSAFLVFLDQMKRQAEEGTLQEELCLIYVSPLKSLAADIRENLRRPLVQYCVNNQVKLYRQWYTLISPFKRICRNIILFYETQDTFFQLLHRLIAFPF